MGRGGGGGGIKRGIFTSVNDFVEYNADNNCHFVIAPVR